jgi:hypothetical protein
MNRVKFIPPCLLHKFALLTCSARRGIKIHVLVWKWEKNSKLLFHLNLPGHSCVLHLLLSADIPGQFFPPFVGAGLLQSLVLVCVPPPHPRVQLSNEDHRPQFPFSFN